MDTSLESTETLHVYICSIYDGMLLIPKMPAVALHLLLELTKRRTRRDGSYATRIWLLGLRGYSPGLMIPWKMNEDNDTGERYTPVLEVASHIYSTGQ